MQPIQGLSRREQNKLERLMKNDEAQKAKGNESQALMHKKSYRRRPGKGTSIRSPPSRKMFKTQGKSGNSQSQQVQSSMQESSKREIKENSLQYPNESQKPKFQIPSYLNNRFPLEGGQAELFNYIMSYSYEEKAKYFQENSDDIHFLDSLVGTPLEKIKDKEGKKMQSEVHSKFQAVKKQIYEIYDEKYQQFIDNLLKNNDS